MREERPVRLLHLSDVHFGWPAVLEQVDAVEAMFARERFDAVVISGDMAQRARAGEFQRGAVFLREAAKAGPTIIVPGNHDVAWWFAPFGLGDPSRVYAKYQRYISPTLEPVLRVPGMTIVGLNTAHGVTWHTLTWDPHDVSVIGDVRPAQLARAAAEFDRSPATDLRVVVMHHNPTFGAISQRYGVVQPRRVIDTLKGMQVDLVLCGHDHQEATEWVARDGGGGMVISTAGTLSSRSRGARPSSMHVVTATPARIDVESLVWSPGTRTFDPGARRCFARSN